MRLAPMIFVHLLLLALAIPRLASPVLAADAELDAAIAAREVDAIVARLSELGGTEHHAEAVQSIPRAYAKVEALPVEEFFEEDRFRVFKAAVGALTRVRESKHTGVLKQALETEKEWRARFLIVHACAQNKHVPFIDFALVALKDGHPLVVAATATYLGRSKKKEAVLPLVKAMERWETESLREATGKGRKEVGGSEVGKAWLACRDALHRLTGISMLSYADYRNYWTEHKEKIDPSKVNIDEVEEEAEGKTSLFGMEVTGINIVFILDISGSMLIADPLSKEDEERLRKRTSVDGDDPLAKQLKEERVRMLRAKRELTKVVSGLPEDKNINIIVFSSGVAEWNAKLVPTSDESKKRAVEFIESQKAEGCTATDRALALAFRDPSVDTIYLLTDGAPTHTSYTGEDLPPDAKKLMDQIKQDLKHWNYLRGVRIHTLGFEGAEEQFLKDLSKEHGGRYKRIR